MTPTLFFSSDESFVARSEEEGCWITNSVSLVRETSSPSQPLSAMRILRAVGLGVLIIILQLLVPRMFRGFENLIVTTFNTAEVTMSISRDALTRSVHYPLLPGESRQR